MRAVPFDMRGSEREGGTVSEPGVRCFMCGSRWSLVVVDTGYRCIGQCPEPEEPDTFGHIAQHAKPRRQPRQAWER